MHLPPSLVMVFEPKDVGKRFEQHTVLAVMKARAPSFTADGESVLMEMTKNSFFVLWGFILQSANAISHLR